MKLNVLQSQICKTGLVCRGCRSVEVTRLRQQLLQLGVVDQLNFECPSGHPWGYVPTPLPSPLPSPSACEDGDGPGSLVKKVFSKLGVMPKPGCGCEDMCQQMNAWGWGGCMAHSVTLGLWFSRKAAERIPVEKVFVVVVGLLSQGQNATAPEKGAEGDSNGGSNAVQS